MTHHPNSDEPVVESAVKVRPVSFKRKALLGSTWTIGGQGASMVLRLASNLILAHLLFPEAFGLMALVNIIRAGLQMLSDVGIRGSVIFHERGDDQDFLDTAWTIQIIRGFLLWVTACVLAYPVARLYGEPMLAQLLPVVGLSAVISGFRSTKLLSYSRRLNLARLTMIELGSYVIGVVFMVVWVLIYPTVWALAFGILVNVVVMTILSHVALPGRNNHLRWDRDAASSMYHFGKWVFFSTVTTFLASRFDRLWLGGFVPMDVLGVYSIAMIFAMMSQQTIQKLFDSVLGPSLAISARSSDSIYDTRLRKAQHLILPISLFGCLSLVFIAPLFFRYLYDPRYHLAGSMAQWMSIIVWSFMLQTFMSRSLLSIGDSRSVAWSNFANSILTVLLCIVGYKFNGIIGLILGSSMGNFAGYVILEIVMIKRGIHTLWTNIIYTEVFILLAIVGGGLAYLFSGSPMQADYRPWPTVALMTLMLGVVGIWVVYHVYHLLIASRSRDIKSSRMAVL